MSRQVKDHATINSSSISRDDVFESTSSNNAKLRATLVEWLNGILPDLNMPINASDEEVRVFLIDGSILCQILNKLKPGSVTEIRSSQPRLENVQRFLSAMDEMGFPRFQAADLENGSMKIVFDCLSTLKTHFRLNAERYNGGTDGRSRWKLSGERNGSADGAREEPFRMLSSPPFGEERRKSASDSKSQRALRSPLMTDPSATRTTHAGHKFHEDFQLKEGSYTDLPAAKISEMMKSNSLGSLLSVVNGILDECIELKNGEIPHRVACLLRKVVQEIERRICTQAEHLRTQNNLFKAREEKYQSRIKVLEALAAGTSDETQIVMNQLQQIKSEKNKLEEKKKLEEHDIVRLMKAKDDLNQEIVNLKKDLEMARKSCDEQSLKMRVEAGGIQQERIDERSKEGLSLLTESNNRAKELENRLKETLNLQAESRNRVKELEDRLKETLGLLTESRNRVKEREDRLKEASSLQTESRNRIKELEAFSESRSEQWKKKQHIYHIFTDFQLGALRELRFASQCIQQEIVRTQKSYSEEFSNLGSRIRVLDNSARNYYSLLAENQKLHNELQELKGNIRVYCRIRPFLPGQKGNKSIVEYIGENGELIVLNPSKQGKEGRRSFKFDKVYGSTATQEEVFLDIQPLIQSVLDGYNVCIFAYGQTGSGKTYTMSGPDAATEKDCGVNYRALDNLFRISRSRESNFTYEVFVQMVEIYNEQVRDLLSNDSSQKRLGISMQSSGLAVPDASLQTVKSTSDVLELMSVGLKNRAKGSTALNERSSRSHSVVSIHARGMDLKSGSSLRGSLHLVDLAGSERVDRSEVTGDRLKEAQHINKSLSALGDVIFALAQKSTHVPYRNSKLTQVLQSSLELKNDNSEEDWTSHSAVIQQLYSVYATGGQAKTLMFVQLNPDATSYSESISTLKFAERVSGVELGAAKSSKDGRDVQELMEQVASLKDTIAKKDEEIETLQLLKDLQSGANGEKPVTNLLSSDLSSDTTCVPDEARHADMTVKTRSTSKVPRTPIISNGDYPKCSTGLRKSLSGTNLPAKSPERWQ
ncbi:hypothetical protein OROGR_009349 [Orobanche gracilis]